ncbi:glycosyltransferase family 2 protein [Parafrankia sp. EUN1f]|uniref:glycosyltransferase family 2 protein n=1 Tax=Parafrankia sp. EUN1f TaxID=102897 RepID=UPI0001C46859|nr:cellulose synthase catalytic subunit [Parafrankia sp. EUN1f]EFC80726.1 Glycosyltransferase probably involved in cell wall biogenesis-like protein [Parafrankia sp. EUN1f]
MAYDYATFSTLAGPLQEPEPDRTHHVAYRRVMAGSALRQVLPLLVVTLVLSSFFFVWLIQPQHFPDTRYLPTAVAVGNHIMFWLIVVTEGIRLLNSVILCWSATLMRDPIPVTPPPGLRVAFTTTIVPSKEPLDVVRDTLIAARNIRYSSPIDVWLLDEGNDPQVRAMCQEIGVRHFTRNGVDHWNTRKGRFRAKTKHGNHNSWLDLHGDRYDVVLSVDPDHIPLANYAERMLGYFRDPNVAFVVGPQVYGNFRHYLTRGAEAQNYMFHSVIQRAANRFACGMFVGTNHAYRVSTWRQIGGFQDSITEDLATSFAVHGARNPETGHRWTSVYTPDVVAVGEGPTSWTDFFSQQLRWARGANEVMVTEAPRRLKALDWGPRLHYSTLMLHYPTVAITWLLGVALTVCYMALGSTGVVVNVSYWLALYIDVFVARLLLYFWLRRFNTSPHEEPGSAGMNGIFVSVLCMPFYSTALVGALFRRKLGFVVTPKGDAASPDRLLTFRKHLFWALISAASIAVAASLGRVYPANMIWASLSLVTCLIPIILWMVEPVLAPRRAAAPNPLPAAHIPSQRVGRTAATAATAGTADAAAAAARGGSDGRPDPAPVGAQTGGDPDPYADDEALSGLVALGTGARRVDSPGRYDPDDEATDRLELAGVGRASGADADDPDGGDTVLIAPPLLAALRVRGGASAGAGGSAGATVGAGKAAADGPEPSTTVTLRRPRPARPIDPASPAAVRAARMARAAARGAGAVADANDGAGVTGATRRTGAGGPDLPANPGYTEDVTLRLHPRRRRVSPEGLLEELD